MEYGSDFHFLTEYPKGDSLLSMLNGYRLYADGRQALEAILINEKIKELYVPSYFCHESLLGVRRLGINTKFYPCTPLNTDNQVLSTMESLNLKKGNAVLRMNYFGLLDKPKTIKRNYVLIEDHSHNPISNWALTSDADWCIASLRKTLPIADGGVLWSPLGHKLPKEPISTQISLQNSSLRYTAMKLKADYLSGHKINKDSFLDLFHKTEENFESMPISAISNTSRAILNELDINRWFNKKKENWDKISTLINLHNKCYIMIPDKKDAIPFSLIFLFQDIQIRDIVKKKLIDRQIYPAVLWRIPSTSDLNSVNFGNRMLSIHCDGRYSKKQIIELSDIINDIFLQC